MVGSSNSTVIDAPTGELHDSLEGHALVESCPSGPQCLLPRASRLCHFLGLYPKLFGANFNLDCSLSFPRHDLNSFPFLSPLRSFLCDSNQNTQSLICYLPFAITLYLITRSTSNFVPISDHLRPLILGICRLLWRDPRARHVANINNLLSSRPCFYFRPL